MAYTANNQFELMTEGQADWDTAQNANWSIAERGYQITATAGTAVVSGQVCTINSAGYVIPYDARSLTIFPQAISYRSVSSGESALFITEGVVSSMTVWSGSIKIGQPVFVAPGSVGLCVGSYPGADRPVGYAVGPSTIRFTPGSQRFLPELTTETASLAAISLGVAGDFSMSLANRGIARRLEVNAQSANAFKVRFWSGSSRVASELLYETLTRSVTAGNSVDVNSRYYLDQAMFPWFNTDTASMALVFGRIDVQSGTQANSSTFNVTVQVERFR